MKVTGIADEGSPGLEEQIRIHRQLGWDTLELRLIGQTNVCQLPEAEFEKVCRTLEREGMGVVCFASPIANWSRPITADFAQDVEDLRRSAPRMRRLGTRFIRVMSYLNKGLAPGEWKRQAIRRMRELARIASGEEVILVHENCTGWGSQSPETQAELLQTVDSPAFRIVFDTGNPVGEGHSPEETWDFYQSARPWIRHIHIKDCRRDEKGEAVYTFPGEGQSMVRRIVKDALGGGYDGALSIEPHIASQIHLGNVLQDGAEAREMYLEYGRRVNRMVEEIAAELKAG